MEGPLSNCEKPERESRRQIRREQEKRQGARLPVGEKERRISGWLDLRWYQQEDIGEGAQGIECCNVLHL
jgi:hypothetical protein